tara:strand:- start:33 stop:284 length:252 start_codon:yes stop_codon:yes gene_type:complete
MERKRPEKIVGYVHPETSAKSRGTVYKTFTEGKKPRKKEKFGKTTTDNPYASYNLNNSDDYTKKSKSDLEKERQTFNAMQNNP